MVEDFDQDQSEEVVPPYRMITTFNAQITKWGFWACGFVIGFLFCLIVIKL